MQHKILFISLFFCPIMVFGQLSVRPNGDVIIGGTLGTATNAPLIFKVNGNLVGSLNLDNISFGYGALKNSTGANNNAFGRSALGANTTGSSNSAFGSWALVSNTTGGGNNAFGYCALENNTTGHSNSAFGYWALEWNATGSNNSAFGYSALHVASTGSNNTAFGYGALRYNEAGSNNTAVGYMAGASNPADLVNATAIGSNAQNTQSHQVILGNSSVTGIGGYVNWTNISDGRVKKNVRSVVPGLAFINLLQPVTYNLDLNTIDEIQKSDNPEINRLRDSLHMALPQKDKEILAKARADKENRVYSGFIAQDVEKAARSVGYDFSGVDAPENDKSVYGLRYAEFVVPLVKAVQELSEQNNKLQEQINELTAKIDALTETRNAGNFAVNNETAKNFSFTLFPNPTKDFVTVDYSLHLDAPVCIELYNIFGQRVKAIVPQQNQKAGIYGVRTPVADLTPGAYIVRMSSGNQMESQQLIVGN